jgi:hypothetical protein
MPEADFDKEVELAALQTKFSKEQTAAYAFVGVMFAGIIGFTALAYSLLHTSSRLSDFFFGFAIIFLGAALLRLWRWGRFYRDVISSDFDKIYRGEKIGLPHQPQPETPKTTPSPGANKITVDRKEFEGFLAENQKPVDRSQALMNRIDQLKNENKQLGNELQATRTRLGSIESNIANNRRQVDDSLRKAWEILSRLTQEADKRTST